MRLERRETGPSQRRVRRDHGDRGRFREGNTQHCSSHALPLTQGQRHAATRAASSLTSPQRSAWRGWLPTLLAGAYGN